MSPWIWPDRDWRAYFLAQHESRCNRSLRAAYDRYGGAKSHIEQQAALYEIILKGGKDGYSAAGPLRSWLARKLRRLAMIVDGFE